MDIAYLGADGFKIKTKTGTVLINPSSGGSCDVAVSSSGQVNLKAVTGTARRDKPFVIEKPGEYEVEGISIFGFQDTPGNILYVVQAEDMRLLHLGNIKAELSEKMIELIDGIDLVFVPAQPSELAIKLVEKVDPYYVLPMGDQAETAKFVSSYGRAPRSVKTLALSKLSLPQDSTEVIVFE